MLVAVMEDGHLVGYQPFLGKHRTVAEMDKVAGFLIGSRVERQMKPQFNRVATDSGVDGLQIRSTLPYAPCGRCGARGWCGHNGRVSA